MINLLANTRSTAFVEAAFRLLEIQEIRNSLIPSQPINIISISADFNQNLYSIYAELSLNVIPNGTTGIPELAIEDLLSEYVMEEYGTDDNISELFAAIASALEIEESSADASYSYNPIIPIESISIDSVFLGDSIGDDTSINLNIEYFGTPINGFDFDTIFVDTPEDEGFYTDGITGIAINPKNIETAIDTAKLKMLVTATIPFSASINNQGSLSANPVDYA